MGKLWGERLKIRTNSPGAHARRCVSASLVAAVVTCATLLMAPPAMAGPGAVVGPDVMSRPGNIAGQRTTARARTTVAFRPGGTATRFAGLAFDTCAAPSLATVKAWGSSRYRAIGVYIGGANRACDQPNLTANWVTAVSKRQWRLLPIYVGMQPPCLILNPARKTRAARAIRPVPLKMVPAIAASQGTFAADDAAAKALALGIRYGSAFYDDIENYSTADASCRQTVLNFVSAWTKELHRLGFLAGVYVNLGSGAPDLSRIYDSPSFGRPDALWVARWDGISSLTGWVGVPNDQWAVHQRAKQYRGPHIETHSGASIDIDSDNLDTPVASVTYPYTVISPTGLNARAGPSTSYPIAKTHAAGSTLQVVCQAPGTQVATTGVWDKLSDGTYVTDFYVSTSSFIGYTPPLPRCTYPYQVTASAGANERSGPGTSYPVIGRLPLGSLAWLVCQQTGSAVGTTPVWDQLRGGRWVSDSHVATPSKTTYSGPAPHCQPK